MLDVCRAQQSDRDNARDERSVDSYSRPVVPAHPKYFCICVASQRLQRRNISERQQRSQCEYQRNPSADDYARDNCFRLECDRHIHRHEILEYCRQTKLNGDAERGTRDGADQSHHSGLYHVHREHLSARCPEAAEDCNRVDLSRDVSANSARYSDSAEQQCDESDNSNEAAQLIDGSIRLILGLVDRHEPELSFIQILSKRFDRFICIRVFRQSRHRVVFSGAPENQKLRRGEISLGDKNARSKNLSYTGRARHRLERADDFESLVPKRDRVADVRVESCEKRGVDESIRSISKR